ncbi:GHKL domain-containing protein [Pseudodesulfovibrio sp. JC047]|uniref:sensor histidine kinase n=1 Tax=Pseudodesulfovibrio sp. JC047 TaxID=2683199 RepID=UPI0013D4C14B|nr:cache domain-containing protein [Pseudodesulfovibrio sp. JC047]NDV18581.1 GHKL domain-containing protein [Pseudodesulfovibrio sp. JC047]
MNAFNEIKFNAPTVIFVLLLLFGLPFLVGLLVQYNYIQDLERVSNERLTLYEMTLESELQKYEYLPYLISENGKVSTFLAKGGDQLPINKFLYRVNTIAGSSVVYIIGTNGIVRAASNWDMPKNFINLDLSFRPYFKDAMSGKEGKFFGVGITAGEPGFYTSHPIIHKGNIIGVAVAKIALSPLEHLWREGGETLFVSDSNGVIVLTSRPNWKYKTLTPLDAAILKRIHDREHYPGFQLKHLPSYSRTRLGSVEELTIGKERFLNNARGIPGTDWKISYLTPQGPLWERTLGISLTTFVLLGLGILTLLFFRERQQKKLSRQQAVEASNIRNMNRQLALEIEERKRTEHELRAAQEELVQAGKLAALGEMATAIAHELNQPIAAVKTYIASCRLMLKRDKLDDLDPTLKKVSDLGDRMAKVTGQLKSFARRSLDMNVEFDLRQAIKEAMNLMKHQFLVENCYLRLSMPGHPVLILGDRMRLEQVLINLFRNALDALQETESPFIGVKLSMENDMAVIRVWDNGPGIAEEVGKKIFEPFVTTKKEGIGVGLGLSISFKIIKDMKGNFLVANRAPHGAEFFVQIPLSKNQQKRES